MEKKRFLKEYVEPIIIAVLIALFVRTFIVQAFKIPSSSMEPTLLVGDYLLVNKFIYGTRFPFTDKKILQFKKPRRGDIIVFIYPKDRSKDFIKRVIGEEGEKVEIIQNKIYINDQLIDDPWGHYSEKNPWLDISPRWRDLARWLFLKILSLFWEITGITVRTAASGVLSPSMKSGERPSSSISL